MGGTRAPREFSDQRGGGVRGRVHAGGRARGDAGEAWVRETARARRDDAVGDGRIPESTRVLGVSVFISFSTVWGENRCFDSSVLLSIFGYGLAGTRTW